jgi:hypothetical protein
VDLREQLRAEALVDALSRARLRAHMRLVDPAGEVAARAVAGAHERSDGGVARRALQGQERRLVAAFALSRLRRLGLALGLSLHRPRHGPSLSDAGGAAGNDPAARARRYGVVVDSVNVSVFE